MSCGGVMLSRVAPLLVYLTAKVTAFQATNVSKYDHASFDVCLDGALPEKLRCPYVVPPSKETLFKGSINTEPLVAPPGDVVHTEEPSVQAKEPVVQQPKCDQMAYYRKQFTKLGAKAVKKQKDAETDHKKANNGAGFALASTAIAIVVGRMLLGILERGAKKDGVGGKEDLSMQDGPMFFRLLQLLGGRPEQQQQQQVDIDCDPIEPTEQSQQQPQHVPLAFRAVRTWSDLAEKHIWDSAPVLALRSKVSKVAGRVNSSYTRLNHTGPVKREKPGKKEKSGKGGKGETQASTVHASVSQASTTQAKATTDRVAGSTAACLDQVLPNHDISFSNLFWSRPFKERLAEKLEATRFEFDVEMTRSPDDPKLGVTVAPAHDNIGGLELQGLTNEGLIGQRNKAEASNKKSTSHQIIVGDRLVALNSKTRSAEIMEEMANKTSVPQVLNLRFSRPHSLAAPMLWEVELERVGKDDVWGLHISVVMDNQNLPSLRVGRLRPGGVVDRWNRRAGARLRRAIYHGDTVIACDDELQPRRILERMQVQKTIKLTILRFGAAKSEAEEAEETDLKQDEKSPAAKEEVVPSKPEPIVHKEIVVVREAEECEDKVCQPEQKCSCCDSGVGSKYVLACCEAGEDHYFRSTCWRSKHGGFAAKQAPRRCACGKLMETIKVYERSGGEDRLVKTILGPGDLATLGPEEDEVARAGREAWQRQAARVSTAASVAQSDDTNLDTSAVKRASRGDDASDDEDFWKPKVVRQKVPKAADPQRTPVQSKVAPIDNSKSAAAKASLPKIDQRRVPGLAQETKKDKKNSADADKDASKEKRSNSDVAKDAQPAPAVSQAVSKVKPPTVASASSGSDMMVETKSKSWAEAITNGWWHSKPTAPEEPVQPAQTAQPGCTLSAKAPEFKPAVSAQPVNTQEKRHQDPWSQADPWQQAAPAAKPRQANAEAERKPADPWQQADPWQDAAAVAGVYPASRVAANKAATAVSVPVPDDPLSQNDPWAQLEQLKRENENLKRKAEELEAAQQVEQLRRENENLRRKAEELEAAAAARACASGPPGLLSPSYDEPPPGLEAPGPPGLAAPPPPGLEDEQDPFAACDPWQTAATKMQLPTSGAAWTSGTSWKSNSTSNRWYNKKSDESWSQWGASQDF